MVDTEVDPSRMHWSLIEVRREYRGTCAMLVPSDSTCSSMPVASSMQLMRSISKGLSKSAEVISGIVSLLKTALFTSVIPDTALTTLLARAKFIRGLRLN